MDAIRFACLAFLVSVLFMQGDALTDITVPTSVLRFTGTPQTVIPRQTPKLYLNCTYTPPTGSILNEMASMTTMVISRKVIDAFGNSVYQEVTAHNENHGYTTNNRHNNEAVEGALRPIDQPSYLNLIITNPGRDQISDYQCEANIMSVYGHPETIYQNISLIEGMRTCTAADIYAVEDELTCTQQALINYVGGSAGRLWVRNLFAAQNIFTRSSDFGGSTYYLLNALTFDDADEAEGACEILGGYLAEIETMAEFNFIVSFTQPYQLPNPTIPGQSQIKSIYLGARDQASEGNWVYQYSGNTVPGNLPFGPGEPNGGRNENCLVIWYYAVQGISVLGDNACDPAPGFPASFLCEVKTNFVPHYSYTYNGISCSYP